MIGLMGLGDDGTLYTTKGNRICRLPMRIGMLIQRAQHWIAKTICL